MSKKAKILLVDDEPGMLRYIRTLLEVDDHHVETASTGEEALDLVQKGLRPDLVLMDLLMPGIDGLETLENLRKLQPGVKVVMLSCVNDTKKVVQAMHLGATDYITKPFEKAELDKVIDQCLGTNQENYPGEVEELGDEIFFVAASPNMRKLRSQAARFPQICWKASYSATKPGLSPAPITPSPESLRFATREPSCSTKSARCRLHCRQNCFTFCRTSSSRAWAAAP